jgi:MYXO-CTERM domain-containing protein
VGETQGTSNASLSVFGVLALAGAMGSRRRRRR